MKTYAGIDLHASNNYVGIIRERTTGRTETSISPVVGDFTQPLRLISHVE